MHLRKCIVISIFLQILQFVPFSNMYINLSIIILLSYKDIMRIMFNNKAEKL